MKDTRPRTEERGPLFRVLGKAAATLQAVWIERFRASWLVILHYHAVQAIGQRTGVTLTLQPSGETVAILDRIGIDRGQIRVAGRLVRPRVRLASERANVDLRNPAPADPLEFDVAIEGALVLRWATDGMTKEQSIRLYSPIGQVRNVLRTLGRLAGFAVGNSRDIAGYFLTGDDAAGLRLERGLLPLPVSELTVRIDAGLFADRPLPKGRPGVDIIVPVHNALKDVRVCLKRVAADLGPSDQILVIDDASTDPEMRPFLRAWAEATPQARVLENPQNLGFVGTVNLALQQCRRHVVLLNSDAFVPAGWLERMLAPILEDERIASVTPLSNDAEICSVPVICQPSALDPGEGRAIDRALCRLDWRAALTDAPTGVGFCMALNRRWLDLVPDLDTAFGKGYGEEVDWCRKTAAMGARHVIQGALFVEHGSGRSFGSTKPTLVKQGNQLISGRYPTYDRLVQEFLHADPAAGPRLAGALAWLAQGGCVTVYLAHSLGGGAEDWLARKLKESIAAGRGAVVIRARSVPETVALEAHTGAGVTRADASLAALGHYLGILPERRVVYSNLVGAHDPLAVLGAVMKTLDPAERLDIVLHDYFALCPSYNLLGADHRFCGLPEPQPCERCHSRLPPRGWVGPDSVADWRMAWRAALDRAQGITVFSPSSKALIARVWPDLEPRLELSPHQPLMQPDPVKDPGPGPLTIGVLGNIGYAKGAAVLRDLCQYVGAEFQIVVIGKVAPDFADPRLIVHGRYDRSEISALARKYRVKCWFVPSIWPETYCFALHECLATKLPVFAFDLGAQADTLARAPNGHLLAIGHQNLSPETFHQALSGHSQARPSSVQLVPEARDPSPVQGAMHVRR